MKSKKAQAWGFDLMIATTLFMAGVIIFYVYSINYPTEGQETLDTLLYEGNFIAESLLSEGFPNNWTADLNNVIRIGILNNNKVNETKLKGLYDWTTTGQGYAQTKAIFNTRYDYFFNFSAQITLPNNEEIDGIGQWHSGNPENLIKITRLTIYQNKPVTLNVYIWQ